MQLRRFTAAAAALALGAGVAGACGSDDSPRQQPDSGNPGNALPEGGNTVTETSTAAITPTGPDQPEVTQPEGGG